MRHAAASLVLAFATMGATAADIGSTILELWDFGDPAASEFRFAAAAKAATPADRLELRTQIARTYGLRRRFDDTHRELDAIEALAPMPLRPAALAARLDLERGRAWRSGGDPVRARPLFERAHATAREAKLDYLAVDAAHMVALVAQGGERFEWNRRALELAQSSTDANARGWQASLLNNIGWDLHEAGRAEEALGYLKQALEVARASGQPQRVFVARWMVARVQRTLGRLTEALAEQRALEAEMMAANRPDGFVFEEIAELLLAQGEEAASQPYFARAWQLLSSDEGLKADSPARLERLQRLAQ